MLDLLTLTQTFGLIGLAELGDKSMFVCLTLATRARAAPVLLGALLAFALLNALAVGAGATLGALIPLTGARALAALLFLGFGAHALRCAPEPEDEEITSAGAPLRQAFTLIFLAELGDKTQLAVAGVASTSDPLSAWVGATAALGCTSAAGVLLGRWLHSRVKPLTLQRAGGLVFLAFGLWLALGLVR